MGKARFKTKTLLQNKYLFYFMLVLAIANIFQFCYFGDVTGIVLFIITCFISSLYFKNKTVIIVISIFIANVFSLLGKEGFGLKKGKDKAKDKAEKSTKQVAKSTEQATEKVAKSAKQATEQVSGGGTGGGGGSSSEEAEDKFNEEKAIREEKLEAARLDREEKREANRLRRQEDLEAELAAEAAANEAKIARETSTANDSGISFPF